MHHITRRLAFVLTGLLLAATAHAEFYCDWELQVLNGNTKEKKYYALGDYTVEIPLDSLPGYKVCRAAPVRVFDFKGKPISRADVYCFTSEGAGLSFQGLADYITGPDITRFMLYGAPTKLTLHKDNPSDVNTSGYREFMLLCK